MPTAGRFSKFLLLAFICCAGEPFSAEFKGRFENLATSRGPIGPLVAFLFCILSYICDVPLRCFFLKRPFQVWWSDGSSFFLKSAGQCRNWLWLKFPAYQKAFLRELNGQRKLKRPRTIWSDHYSCLHLVLYAKNGCLHERSRCKISFLAGYFFEKILIGFGWVLTKILLKHRKKTIFQQFAQFVCKFRRLLVLYLLVQWNSFR